MLFNFKVSTSFSMLIPSLKLLPLLRDNPDSNIFTLYSRIFRNQTSFLSLDVNSEFKSLPYTLILKLSVVRRLKVFYKLLRTFCFVQTYNFHETSLAHYMLVLGDETREYYISQLEWFIMYLSVLTFLWSTQDFWSNQSILKFISAKGFWSKAS